MEALATDIQRREFLRGTSALTAVALFLDTTGALADGQRSCPTGINPIKPVPDIYYTKPGLLALRADALLRQIGSGCGYYGQPRNWVPLSRYDQLKNSLQTILTNATVVDTYLDNLVRNCADVLQNVAGYENTIAAALSVQSQLNDNLTKYNQEATDLLVNVIPGLQRDIVQQRNEVDSAQASFNQAVLDAAAGGGGPCGFNTILNVVIAVVAAVAAVYTAGASLVAAYGAISSLAATGIGVAAGATGIDALKAAYEKVKPIVQKIETAAADLRAIGAKYEVIKKDLEAAENSARIIVPKEDYDILTDRQFTDFSNKINDPGVQVSAEIKNRLIQAVKRYMELVHSFNQKIYEHDSLIVQIQNTARQYYERQIEIEQVRSIEATYVAGGVPDQVSYIDTIQRIRAAQLDVMRQLLWEEKRAEALWRVDPSVLDQSNLVQIIGVGAGDLLQTHNGILQDYTRWNLNQSSAVTSFNQPKIIKIILSLHQRESFRQTRRFRFVVDVDHPAFSCSMRHIFLTGVRVLVEPASAVFRGNLVHLGRQRFRRLDGILIDFASDVTRVNIETPMAHATDFTGIFSSEKLQGLSPFSEWSIEADDNLPLGIIDQITEFQFIFDGNYRTGGTDCSASTIKNNLVKSKNFRTLTRFRAAPI
jgi:hypothetical protein